MHDEIPIEVIHKEIDLIQNSITRMANNSFAIKGWFISLVAIIIALVPDNIGSVKLSLLLTAIILVFWYFDSYFLLVEKEYRSLYEWVIIERQKQNRDYLYNMEHKRFRTKVKGRRSAIFSSTLLAFYGMSLIVVVIYSAIN